MNETGSSVVPVYMSAVMGLPCDWIVWDW